MILINSSTFNTLSPANLAIFLIWLSLETTTYSWVREGIFLMMTSSAEMSFDQTIFMFGDVSLKSDQPSKTTVNLTAG